MKWSVQDARLEVPKIRRCAPVLRIRLHYFTLWSIPDVKGKYNNLSLSSFSLLSFFFSIYFISSCFSFFISYGPDFKFLWIFETCSKTDREWKSKKTLNSPIYLSPPSFLTLYSLFFILITIVLCHDFSNTLIFWCPGQCQGTGKGGSRANSFEAELTEAEIVAYEIFDFLVLTTIFCNLWRHFYYLKEVEIDFSSSLSQWKCLKDALSPEGNMSS